MSVTYSSTFLHTTRSTLASGRGRRSSVICRNRAGTSGISRSARARARSSMSALRSAPTIAPSGPTRRPSSTASPPGPHP